MKKSILIVDDEELNRELLKQMFKDDYDIIEAENGNEAIYKLMTNINKVVVVLLDLVMPGLDGYQVLQMLKRKNITDRIPVVLVTANSDTNVEFQCYSMGASAIISKPFSAKIVRQQVFNIIEMNMNALKLERTVKNQEKKLNIQQHKLDTFYDNLLDTISNIVEFRDLESGMHVKRVKGLTRIMAEAYMNMYPESGLDYDMVDTIVRSAAMHDIGKIAIPDRILLKPGRLTDEERQIMEEHTTKGCEILDQLEDLQDAVRFQTAYDICRHHHERYDGKGYPDKLKGDEIPLSAQLVSIVDVYDALVSERVYKKPFSNEKAYEMIVEGQCGIFAPKILNCFAKSRAEIEALSDSYK